MLGKISIVIFGLFILLQGCDSRHKAPGNPTLPSGNNALKTSIDFEQIKTQVLLPYCISCHQDGRRPHEVYRTYSLAKADAVEMLSRVNTSDRELKMPVGETLPANLKEMLKEWVLAGAPEFATATGGEGEEPDVPISFSEIKERILIPYNCTKCHSQYNDYAPTARKISSIVGQISQDKMPFPKERGHDVEFVSAPDKALLDSWVKQGFPEFAHRPSEPLPPVELKATWVSLRNEVFGPKCILCHNSFGNRAPTNMATHGDLINWFRSYPKLFDFAEPNKSHFVGSMLGRVNEEEFFLDPMPLNIDVDDVEEDLPAVTPEELEIIEEWIGLGLPYN